MVILLSISLHKIRGKEKYNSVVSKTACEVKCNSLPYDAQEACKDRC
jgi:hypothetical protein